MYNEFTLNYYINKIAHNLKNEPRGPVINNPTVATDTKVPTIASLEARIDKMEDHSRRNNLLFYGFSEDSQEERCENRVCDLLAKVILRNTRDVNTIDIVRAHRLGAFNAGHTRPIIVKFERYSDKNEIMQNVFKGALSNTSGKWVTEDFSVNTTNDRKFLRDQLLGARSALGDRIKNSSVRYKAIHVTSKTGIRSVFHLNKVLGNPNWWKDIGNNNIEAEFENYTSYEDSEGAKDTNSDFNKVTDEGDSLSLNLADGGSSSEVVEEPVVLEPTVSPASEIRRASG